MDPERRRALRELIEDLIESYDRAEETCIREYSSTTRDADLAEHRARIAEYRADLDRLLPAEEAE